MSDCLATADPQTYAIIGAAMEVHRQLGSGYLEPVYREALQIEFEVRDIPHDAEVALRVEYKQRVLTTRYRADFVCYGSVLVEAKAQRKLTGVETAQVLNYLKTSGLQRALLVNFGGRSLEFERYVRSAGSLPRVVSADLQG
jgi:GxxExxY protein